MSILIVGSSGFIGSNLVSDLNKKGHTIGIDRVVPPSEAEKSPHLFFRADITNDNFIEKVGAEMAAFVEPGEISACIHLAAVAAPRIAASDPGKAWDTNVRGTFNVLGLCRNLGIRKFVFASSAHVYGISPRYLPTDENHPLALHDTYTVTKIAGEKLCELFHSNYQMSTTILRLFNVYGPGQSPDYFLGVKLRQAMEKKEITLMNGDVTKDWIHSSDAVKAFELAAQSEYVGAINIGTGIETSLKTMAGIIATSKSLPVVDEPGSDNSPTRMLCDNRLARSVLGWEPEVSVLFGLNQLLYP